MAVTKLWGVSDTGKVVEFVEIDELPTGVPADGSVTNVKLANMATDTIKGRDTAGTGVPEDLTPAAVRTMLNVADGATANASDASLRDRSTHTGTQLASTISDLEEAVEDFMGVAIVAGSNMTVTYNDGAGTITLDAAAGVPGSDTVTNAILANMADSTIKGRTAGAGTGDPVDLTAAQTRTILNVADGATANSSDATLLARANHTGTQLSTTISDFAEAVQDVAGVAIVAGTNMTVTYNDGAGTITLDAASGVPGADSVTNTILANMAESTIKGRATGAGSGDPTDLTATQVRTLINVADGSTANSSDATLLARANHTGTQLASTISDFNEAVDDRVDALLVEGTGITLTYNDGAGTITIDAAAAASGNFTPVGTGATVRTMDVKVREMALSVKDYGAVADDATNNVTAFNNAINAAAAGCKRLYIPSGTYRFNSTLTIDENIHIFGDDRATTILKFYNTTGHGVDFSGVPGQPNLIPTEMNDVTILQASGVNQTDGSHGLRVACKAHMTRVFVDSFTNDAFYLDQQTPGDNTTSPFFCRFDSCQAVDPGRDGWAIRAGANANVFINCQSVRALRYGVHHYTDGYGTYGNVWIGGQASYSAQYGFYHESGTDCLYDHVYAEGSGRSGGVGYVNTQFDIFMSQNSDRCRMYLGSGGGASTIRAPARGSLESCGVWIGGQRVYGNTASTPEANEGVLYNIPTRASAVATIGTANATDLASAITLVNQCKTTINNLLTQLRAGRMIEP